jgi:hypothetical protein
VEELIGRNASARYGVVTRAELISAGITEEEIRQRLRRGTLFASIAASIGWDTEHRAVRRATWLPYSPAGRVLC